MTNLTFVEDDGSGPSGRLLVLVLVVAFLLCHGVFGGLHGVSWPAGSAPAHHGTGDAGASQGHHQERSPEDRGGGHPAGSSEYVAAFFAVLLLGTVAALLLGGVPLRGSAAGLVTFGRVPAPPILPPPRGPTATLLQVFRL